MGVIPLGGLLDVDLVCGISCRGPGRTNLVVAIGRDGLLVAISGALGRRGLLIAVTLRTFGAAMSASQQCPAVQRPVVRTDSNQRTAAVAGERILQRCSPQGIQTYPGGQSAAGSSSERRGGSGGQASGRRWPRKADRRAASSGEVGRGRAEKTGSIRNHAGGARVYLISLDGKGASGRWSLSGGALSWWSRAGSERDSGFEDSVPRDVKQIYLESVGPRR